MSNNYHVVTSSGCETVSLRVVAQDGTACFYRANGAKVYVKPGEWHEETECPLQHHHDGVNAPLLPEAITEAEAVAEELKPKDGEGESDGSDAEGDAPAGEPADPPKRGRRGFRRSRN